MVGTSKVTSRFVALGSFPSLTRSLHSAVVSALGFFRGRGDGSSVKVDDDVPCSIGERPVSGFRSGKRDTSLCCERDGPGGALRAKVEAKLCLAAVEYRFHQLVQAPSLSASR